MCVKKQWLLCYQCMLRTGELESNQTVTGSRACLYTEPAKETCHNYMGLYRTRGSPRVLESEAMHLLLCMNTILLDKLSFIKPATVQSHCFCLVHDSSFSVLFRKITHLLRPASLKISFDSCSACLSMTYTKPIVLLTDHILMSDII